MNRFFKVNDPYRLLAVLLFLVATRAAVFIFGNPYLLMHEESEQLGAAINAGNLVYEQASSNAGPLYGYFYSLITWLTADSLIFSVILSTVFVMIQAFVLNTMLIRLAAFNENTYLPALIYAALLSASPEFLLLSPELVALTFVLAGLNYLLTHLKYRGTEENIISTGFLFGLAALMAKPAFFCLGFVILVYLLYSNTLNRRYVLMFFGFALPFVMFWLYYFWNDLGASFWSSYFSGLVHMESRHLIPSQSLLIWIGFPVLVALIAAAQNFTGVGMTNNQIQMQRSMLWLGVFGLFFYLISANGSFNELIWVMPAVTYFATMLVGSMQRAWMAELTVQVIFWGALYFCLAPLIEPAYSLLDLSGLIP